MTKHESIKKALAGGWKPKGVNESDIMDWADNFLIGHVLLDPSFWKCLGVGNMVAMVGHITRQNYVCKSGLGCEGNETVIPYHNDQCIFETQHAGGTIDSYFETL